MGKADETMRAVTGAIVRGLGLLVLVVAGALLWVQAIPAALAGVGVEVESIDIAAVTLFAHQATAVLFSLVVIAVMARQARREAESARKIAAFCLWLTLLLALCLIAAGVALAVMPGTTFGAAITRDAPWAAIELFTGLADLSHKTDPTGAALVALWVIAAAALTAREPTGRIVARVVTGLTLLALPIIFWPRQGLLFEALPTTVQSMPAAVDELAFFPALLVLLAAQSFALSTAFRPSVFYLLTGTFLVMITSIDLNAAARGMTTAEVGTAALHLRHGAMVLFGLLAVAATRHPEARPGIAFGAQAVALAVLMIAVGRLWAFGGDSMAAVQRLATGIAIIIVVALAGRLALSRGPRPEALRTTPRTTLPALPPSRAVVVHGGGG